MNHYLPSFEYRNWTSLDYSASFCPCATTNSVFNYIFFNRRPIDITVTPDYTSQRVRNYQKNRYVRSVTVSRIPVVSSEITLAVGATSKYTFTGAVSASSSVPATATVSITDGVVEITAVAAGTSAVTILDKSGNTIATITVTVA